MELEIYSVGQFYESNLTDEKIKKGMEMEYPRVKKLDTEKMTATSKPSWGTAWYIRVFPDVYTLYRQNWDSSG